MFEIQKTGELAGQLGEKNQKRAAFLRLNLFFLGFVSLVAQTVLYREALIFVLGNELVLGAILSIWLLGGAFAGYFCLRVKRKLFVLKLLHPLVVFSLPLSLLILRTVGASIVPFGEAAGFFQFFLISLLSLFPLNLLLTSEFLICMALVSEDEQGGAGLSYFLESLGAFAGAIIFAFFLSSRWLSWQIMIALSILLVLISFLLYFRLEKVVSTSLLLILLGSWSILPQVESGTRRFYFRGWTLSRDTPVQNITLTKVKDQTNLFLNGQFSGFSGLNFLSQLPAHLPLSLVENPERVLVVGGLTTALVKEVLKHPVKEVVALELDPEVVRVVKDAYPKKDTLFFRDGRLKVVFADARQYLSAGKDKYDVIILDVPGPQNILLARLYTAEFMKEVKRHLKPEGVFCSRSPFSVEYLSEEVRLYEGSLVSTVKTSFPKAIVIPGGSPVLIGFLKDKAFTASTIFEVLRERKVKLDLDPAFLNHSLERARYFEGKPGDDFLVNNDDRPISIFLSSLIFQKTTGSPFRQIDYLILRYPYLFLILIFFPLIFSLIKGKRELSVVFSAGLAGMVAEVSLIYVFQLNVGFVYSQVSLLLAFFMLGLSLGGYFFKKRSGYLLTVATCLLLFLLFFPFSVAYHPLVYSLYFYLVLLVLLGFLIGAVFPLTVADLGVESSSLVYSVDLFAGALGAFLAGALMLPLLGLKNTSFLVALLLLVSILILITPLRKLGR